MKGKFLFCSKTKRLSGGISTLLLLSFGIGQGSIFAEDKAAPTEPPLIRQTASLAVPQPATIQGDIDAALKRFQPGQEPVMVPPITFVDVNSGRFKKLELDLTEGQFLDTAVDKLHLVAKDLDVREGLLKSLDIAVQGGHLKDFIFDQLRLSTSGELTFDSGVFLNHHILQFTEPAQAEVSALVSQESLNTFLRSPKILERLSITAGKKANAIASIFGLGSSPVGLNLLSASASLEKGSRIALHFQSSLGVGQVGVPIDGVIMGKLGIKEGNLNLEDTKIVAAAQELPPEMVKVLLNKINSVATTVQKSNDIRFQFSDLKVVAGKNIQLKGTAVVSRLRFGA